MTWRVVLGGDDSAWMCPEVAPDVLPARGALVIEAMPQAGGAALLAIDAAEGQVLRLLAGDGEVTLDLGRRWAPERAVLQVGLAEALRVTLNWDRPAGEGWIAVEDLSGRLLDAAALPALPAVAPLDMARVRVDPRAGLAFAALADALVPIGPMPGLPGDLPVEVNGRFRRLDELQTGDTVRVAGGEIVPVLARVSRRLPAAGSFAPVTLGAAMFGVQRDVSVAAHQRLAVEGPRVAALLERDRAVVRAGDVGVRPDRVPPLVTWHQLLLPEPAPLAALGICFASLHAGGLRASRALHAQSLLAGVPASILPEHPDTQPAPVRPAAARALAEVRVA